MLFVIKYDNLASSLADKAGDILQALLADLTHDSQLDSLHQSAPVNTSQG